MLQKRTTDPHVLVCAFVFVLVALDGFADTQSTALLEVVTQLHKLRWTTTTMDDVEKLSKLHFQVESVPYPPEITEGRPCKPSVYLRSIADGIRLSLEFEALDEGGTCRQLLEGVAVEGKLKNNEAGRVIGAFLSALKPGGQSCTRDPNESEYIWRSKDSRIRYDLYISTVPKSLPATPETMVELKLILKQSEVKPADVDDLPFEKGTFFGRSHL